VWTPGGKSIGVGAEVGLGWVFFAAVNGSYHFLGSRRYDLFAQGGAAVLGSDEFSSRGVTIGGGFVYWAARHVALRLDGFKYVAASTDNNIPADQRSPSRYWGARAGVAFRFR
jgi:hypothetical protein